jgi:hypothetical protein
VPEDGTAAASSEPPHCPCADGYDCICPVDPTAEDAKSLAAVGTRWQLRSREINEFVVAADQWEAWDTLRDRSIYDFGLVVSAEPHESGDHEVIPVHTATLMRRWGRDDDAEQFDELARKAGLL